MNYARQFARHAALTVATTLVTGALFYLLRIVLYKNLTQEEYGLFYVLFSYVTIIQTVVTFGFDPGLVPYVTRYREENNPDAIKSVALGSLAPQAVITAIVVALFLIAPPHMAPWFARFPDAPSLVRVLANPASPSLFRVLALHAVLVLLFKCGQQVLLGMQAIAWRNAADLARAFLCLGSAFLLLQWGWGIHATGIAYTLGALAEAAVLTLAIFIAYPHIVRARFTWRPALVREVFQSGKWLSIAFGGIVMFSSVDTMIISLVRRDLADAAAYQIALPTITILYSLMIAAGISLLPTVRTLWLRGEHALLADGVGRIYTIAILLMIPTGVLLASCSDVLMTSLFGNNPLNADAAFDVLAIGGVAFFIAYINLHVLAGIDRPRIAGIAVIGGLFVDIALSLPLTYIFGIRGSAIAGIAGYAVAAGISLMGMRRLLDVRVSIREIVAALALGLAVWTSVQLLRNYGCIQVGRPMLSGIAGLGTMLVCLCLFEIIGFIKLRELLQSIQRDVAPPPPNTTTHSI